MVLSKTPYRISLFGGGSDYPAWLKNANGATLSFSAGWYSHIFMRALSPVFGAKYRIRYYKREEAKEIEEIKHPIIRHALLHRLKLGTLSRDQSLDIIHSGDFPAMTGLGTSSCFTVGFLKALDKLTLRTSSKYSLAKEAIYIEQVLNGEQVGCQDQIAAAFGGINYVEYTSETDFRVFPMNISQQWLENFTAKLHLVYTGLTRHSSEQATEFVTKMPANNNLINKMIDLAKSARDLMVSGGNMDELGNLLHESWAYKKASSGRITNVSIDQLYHSLCERGAIGGKLLGAGGGGFLLVYVPDSSRERFIASTSDEIVMPVTVDWDGASAVIL